MFCINELNQWLKKLEEGHSIISSNSIDEYIKCAKEQNLTTQYFPVVDSGFIVYKEKTIILTSQQDGTKLSIKTV